MPRGTPSKDRYKGSKLGSAYPISKKITISNSFEDADEAQLRYWAKLTPEQRFEGFYELMSRFYNFTKPNWAGKKIIIDK